MDVHKSLAQVRDRLQKAREDLRIAEEQVVFQADVLEDAKTRMLVSETPLAEREYREASGDYERLVRQRDDARKAIAELQSEQDRLLDRMLGSTR